MSSPCHTPSPHKVLLAKTMDACQHTEAEWCLVSKGELNPVSSDDKHMAKMQDEVEKRAQEEAKCLVCKEATKKVQEEAERKAEEECKVQEEAARAWEEAERLAKEAAGREEAAKRAAEAAEERADAKRRAIKEHLWEAAGQQSETVVAPPQVAKPSRRMMVAGPSASGCRASGVQDPCTRCCNKGTPCMLSAAKGKTMACKACHHAKVSCSWTKKTAGELRKQKQVQRSEEAEEIEVVKVDEDEDEERLHFAVLQHLMEEHQDALGALMTTLDTLVATLQAIETITNKLQRANDLKEEEMGRSKGKGKEKAQEEFRRARTEDDNGDMEMGRAGPSSLA
ncbi:hypothetical protein ID866_12002 [Astraeus odoratus]|nr:hypothetical protein ID866_12002 [Astraeus odoratus]